jgi:hypothetical protein
MALQKNAIFFEAPCCLIGYYYIQKDGMGKPIPYGTVSGYDVSQNGEF